MRNQLYQIIFLICLIFWIGSTLSDEQVHVSHKLGIDLVVLSLDFNTSGLMIEF